MELKVAGRNAYAYSGGKAFVAKLPSVVFIHGGAHDHSVWILQSRYLAHHGFGVLAVDLPGHGRSGGAPLARIEDMAGWIVAALDAAGVKTAALVGHSMGSLAALDCAARWPERVQRIALLGAAFPMRVSPELLEATSNDEPRAHGRRHRPARSDSRHVPAIGNVRIVSQTVARLWRVHAPGSAKASAVCETRSEALARATEIGRVYRALMGDEYPAMAMVEVAALIEDRAKVEIEVTAVVPQAL